MIQIPEELLKMSEKELNKVLSDNIYKAKYLVSKDDNTFHTKVSSSKNEIVLREVISNSFRVIDSANLEDDYTPLTKDLFSTIKRQNIESTLHKMSWKKILKILTSMAVDIYGDEFVDTTSDSIIIYFPEVTIKNSCEQSHVMKDIYIRFNFYSRGKVLADMEIARTTFTERELRNHYLFSHCGEESVGSYSNDLCKGSTSIAESYSLLRKDLFLLIKGFTPFLYVLKEYLSWESLEGSPYRKIDDVITDANRMINKSSYTCDTTYILSKLILSNKLENLKYNYELNDGIYRIKLDIESVNTIDKILIEILDNRFISHYYYNRYNGTKSEVKFKGNIITNAVIPDTERPVDITSLPIGIDRSLLKKIVYDIETQLTQFINNKRIEENV
jgi:hypothetical protein